MSFAGSCLKWSVLAGGAVWRSWRQFWKVGLSQKKRSVVGLSIPSPAPSFILSVSCVAGHEHDLLNGHTTMIPPHNWPRNTDPADYWENPLRLWGKRNNFSIKFFFFFVRSQPWEKLRLQRAFSNTRWSGTGRSPREDWWEPAQTGWSLERGLVTHRIESQENLAILTWAGDPVARTRICKRSGFACEVSEIIFWRTDFGCHRGESAARYCWWMPKVWEKRFCTER